MTTTFTEEHAAKLRAYLDTHTLPVGLGNEEAACSIAAINLAIDGRLTDDIPPCMSEVIGQWIIKIQDAMPAKMRNSNEWKSLLPLAAGTGRDLESQRLAIVMDWMWTVLLPKKQPIADANGFGKEWSRMTTEKTAEAAYRAAEAAEDASVYACARAARAACAACAADAADYAAHVADHAAPNAVKSPTFWAEVDPVGCLRRMIEVAEPTITA